MGKPLISSADETKGDRVLSRDEEERLLLAFSADDLSPLPSSSPYVRGGRGVKVTSPLTNSSTLNVLALIVLDMGYFR